MQNSNKLRYLAIFVIGLLVGCSSDTTIKWHQEETYRWAEVSPGFWGSTGFSVVDASTSNITFENHLTEDEMVENRHLLNGSGVAAGDIDGDGLVDLYFANLNGPNKLYKNLGNFSFRDVTEFAGVTHANHYSTGVVFANLDRDDDLDLLVGSLSKGVTVYLNDGSGRFLPQKNSGLDATSGKGNTTLALADVDGDDDLDLYVTNYKERSAKDIFSVEELVWDNITRKNGDSFELVSPFDEHYQIFKGENQPDRREFGEIDMLYLNQGNATFNLADPKTHFLDQNGNPVGLKRDWGLTAF